MNDSKNITSNQDLPVDKLLDGVLDAISQYFEAKSNSLKEGKELLGAGAKTAEVVEIENMIKYPVEEIDKSISKLKSNAFQMLNGAAKSFFDQHSDILLKVVRTEANSALHYCIAFKEDSPEARFRVLKILEGYESAGYSRSFPMYFQFVSQDLIERIPYTEILLASTHE